MSAILPTIIVAETYISRGYTRAFASTAPVAPAKAFPHGGSGSCFDRIAINQSAREQYASNYQGERPIQAFRKELTVTRADNTRCDQ